MSVRVARRRLLLLLLALVLGGPSLWAQAPVTEGTLRIYLARHGESEANLAGVSTGWSDAALTPRGRQQAQSLAESLRGIPIDAIYSSTLARSRNTAEAVAGTSGRAVTALPGLRERNWGAFTGRKNNDPEYLRRRATPGDSLDGGESIEQFFERVRTTVLEIRRQHTSGAILIVGHAATNAQVLRTMFDLTPEQSEMIDQANDEVYAIDVLPGRAPLLWKLIRATTLNEL